MTLWNSLLETLAPYLNGVGETLLFVLTALSDFTAGNVRTVVEGVVAGGVHIFPIFPAALLLLVEITIALSLVRLCRMLWYLSHEWVFFSHKVYYASPGKGGQRILIIGDSTAYGRGASRPEDTLAGRFGHDFPAAEIVNKAVNGSGVKEALKQIRQTTGVFDLIVISTGGNDVWSFRSVFSVGTALKTLVSEAVARSNHQVVLLFYTNFNIISIFPKMLQSTLAHRSRQFYTLFESVAAMYQVPLVDLFTTFKSEDIFSLKAASERNRYVAPDKMHPNSEGYRLWYNRLWKEMLANHLTLAAKARPVAPSRLSPPPSPSPTR